jgi:hypothetical protein
LPRSSAAPSHAEIARKPEPQRHGWEPAVCGPRCGLLVWPTCRWHSVMGEQPVSSQSADAGVGQQAARRAMSRCSRRQFRRLFGAYDRAKGHHMAIVPASGWRGSCDVPVGWTEEHQSVHAEPREWSSESGAAPVPWRADISTETRPNGWDHRPLCWPCARAEARPVTPGGHWKRGCARQAGSTGRRGRPARRRDSGEEFWTRVKNSSPEPIEAL